LIRTKRRFTVDFVDWNEYNLPFWGARSSYSFCARQEKIRRQFHNRAKKYLNQTSNSGFILRWASKIVTPPTLSDSFLFSHPYPQHLHDCQCDRHTHAPTKLHRSLLGRTLSSLNCGLLRRECCFSASGADRKIFLGRGMRSPRDRDVSHRSMSSAEDSARVEIAM